MVLSLYSSRLVLNILGVEDYGIYALVAGVVSMLSFITNSLVSSTQRYLSVAQGIGNLSRLKEIFSNSLYLHIIIGLGITIILELLTPAIFNGFLNIPSNRIGVAKLLYQFVVLMVYISFIAAPYKALLVSRENIIYTSFVDVLDGILKVMLVLLLPYATFDKLLAYGCIMLLIQVLNLLAYSVFAHSRYEEAVIPRFKRINYSYIKELLSFTGWMVYSTVCITAKTQGLAVVLNKALDTVANAAYGIGIQISSMLSFVSSSLNNAIAPQLMSAEGSQNRSHMYFLAEVGSKFSFLLLAMIGIPTLFEMPTLLKVWLGDNVPSNTILWSSTFIIAQVIDMLSTGLGLANKAIGNVARYTIFTTTPKLLVLPIGWLLLKFDCPLWTVCGTLLFFETLCMFVRIWLFRGQDGFDMGKYIYTVIIKSMIPVLVSFILCKYLHSVVSIEYRLFVTYIVSMLLFATTTYFFVLSAKEKEILTTMLNKFISKIR